MEVWVTPRAEAHFDALVTYIQDTWGTATSKQFIEKADEIFSLLANYPLMGSMEEGDIRGFRLTTQIRMLYRIIDQRILILAFFDVRQNPEKKYG